MKRKQNISATNVWLWAVVTAFIALPASGAPILIFNTGVVSQNPLSLAIDGAVDMHYALIASADANAPGPNAYAAGPNGVYPIPPWLENAPDSKWITPFVNPGTTATAGTYVYRTTFDLSGLDAGAAVLTGRWATDNTGTMVLNGLSLGIASGGYDAWSPFTITSGFVDGLNSLDFVITNNVPAGGNPTGLRVEISGEVATGIPEPSTNLLVAFGLCGLAGYFKARTRQRKPRHTRG